ncbi:MAG: DUF1611 domain-containing protein [Steroidobacteraceae bacterium]
MTRFDCPFVVFLGDIDNDIYAKTALGLVQWRGEDCVGQMRLPGCTVDAGVPDVDVARARAAGAKSLIIGSAAVGGGIPKAGSRACARRPRRVWTSSPACMQCLASLPGLEAAAAKSGARLVDLRVPPPGLPVGTGRKRAGRRLLTVGTDCACGKKYTALAIDRELRRRGIASDFRATGQTGIMIAGRGIPIDAVVADFVTGAAELLSPENDPKHWDIVEGQGSIVHPGYLQVTIGLLVSRAPDAFVVCHDPPRDHLSGLNLQAAQHRRGHRRPARSAASPTQDSLRRRGAEHLEGAGEGSGGAARTLRRSDPTALRRSTGGRHCPTSPIIC